MVAFGTVSPVLSPAPATTSPDEIFARYKQNAERREQEDSLAAVRLELQRMEADARAEEERQRLLRAVFDSTARADMEAAEAARRRQEEEAERAAAAAAAAEKRNGDLLRDLGTGVMISALASVSTTGSP